MTKATTVSVTSVHRPLGYSHAVRVGDFLFLAGQVARDVDGQIIGKGDIAAQADQVFANIKGVLEDAGSSLDNVVKLTTFATDARFLGPIAESRKRFFGEYLPPNTFVVIHALALPDFLLEIEAVAVVG